MVTLIWASPLYSLSLEVSRKPCHKVICHHRLAGKDWQTQTDGRADGQPCLRVGWPSAGLAWLAACLAPPPANRVNVGPRSWERSRGKLQQVTRSR
jgi:hypothetical protein